MIDLGLLRKHPELVKRKVLVKDPSYDIDQLIELDTELGNTRVQVESLRAEKNRLAQLAKGLTDEIRQRSILVGRELREKIDLLEKCKQEFDRLYFLCPNLPEDDIPEGTKEQNKVIKFWGKKPHFSFVAKNHFQLGNELGWFDFDAATRMTGARFALYKDRAVELVYALSMYMLSHNKSCGYKLVLPPYLVNETSMFVSSNLPKFRDQAYAIEHENLFLTPTAEVNLTNIYRDMIIPSQELPIRMTAWTSCFRREAGGYGANERGLIRIHQFEKCELYTLCEPDAAEAELQRMLWCAEELLQGLELHYQVVLLAAQDCSFPSAKTYDIEVWLPGQSEYKEVASVSICTDFQARRGKIRYREKEGEKTKLVFTLNGSSLAVPRLMVALMETYQQEDGSIAIPQLLNSFGIQ